MLKCLQDFLLKRCAVKISTKMVITNARLTCVDSLSYTQNENQHYTTTYYRIDHRKKRSEEFFFVFKVFQKIYVMLDNIIM